MSPEFNGRLVVVTGGTGALGTAVVSHLIDAGARVRIPVRVEGELGHFPHADSLSVELVLGVDMCDPDAAGSFFAGANDPIWASIHLAGGFAMGPICETGVDVFDDMMTTNARTCFVSCRAAAARMRGQPGGGRIVNVAARNALFPELGADMVAYTASKAAVAAITQSLGAELASEGIWVNAVVPSTIDTRANRLAMPDADHEAWPSCESIAETICFLASPENRATRSALVPVYGRA